MKPVSDLTGVAATATDTGMDDVDMSGSDRRCVVTRESAPREGLIRLVISPDGVLTPDLTESLPGRGVWVSSRREVLGSKALPKAASRSVKLAVTVPGDLVARVERLLLKRCQETLGLARRAGQVEIGFEKARAAVVSGGATLLLTAADSNGRDGQELARRAAAQPQSVRCSNALTAAGLGAALGRERQVHVALADSALAKRLYRDMQRLSGIRQQNTENALAGQDKNDDVVAARDSENARDEAQGR